MTRAEREQAKHILGVPREHVAVAMLVGLITLMLVVWNPAWLRLGESLLLDAWFKLRGVAAPAEMPVAIVSVDEASLGRFGRWPWPRDRMARLIEAVQAAGARTIVTDLVFPEPAPGDARLAAVMRKARVVQGFFWYPELGDALLQGYDPAAEFERVAKLILPEVTDRADSRSEVIAVAGLRANAPLLAAATDAGGFLNFVPDEDGALRFAPLIVRHQGFYLPSLALAAVRRFLGDAPLSAEVRADGVTIRFAQRRIEANAQGLVWIGFLGPAGTVPTFSAADAMAGALPPDALRGKLVFIGVGAAGAHDVRPTPVDALMPGTEVQAQLAMNLLQGGLLRRPDGVYGFELAMILLTALGYGLLFHRLIARTHGRLTPLLIVIWLATGYAAFLHGVWLHVLPVAAQGVVTFAWLFTLYSSREQEQRERLREAFASFVDPAVVGEVVDRVGRAGLSGEEREISVMFVDVEGFTRFSERLEPAEVVRCINAFFDAATPILFRYHATIDRLTGDGLIALFGAPLEDPDHAIHACRAALALDHALAPVRSAFAQAGHDLRVRVGINTGRMVVGNMGSSRRMQYTFMGDAGNAAARLESLNKQYGTRRMIGPRTRALLGDAFVTRELDTVVLVGKREPMVVHELIGPVEDKPRFAEMLAAWEAALALYRRGDFSQAADAFGAILGRFDDPPAGVMRARCLELAADPPDDWQGVWVLRNK
ncbi:MAG: adenylate/guanylate cyclase domain-containing protein [Mariprofundaceae bacterium]